MGQHSLNIVANCRAGRKVGLPNKMTRHEHCSAFLMYASTSYDYPKYDDVHMLDGLEPESDSGYC